MTKKGKGFSDRLERVLDCDDKVRFVKLLQDHPSEITKSLLDKCAELGAKKCLLALLEGEVCKPPPALDDQSFTTLACVTHSCPEPRIIELMLTKCNAISLVNVRCAIGLVDGYPIHFALVHLSYLEHLYPWARGDSLIKLVMLLCQWKTKPILDCVRLLAQYTDSINDIAWSLVKYGALKQFGALLLVAREKVMAPFDTGLTIREYIFREISPITSDMGSEEAEYEYMLRDARLLLDVFNKAGDSLSSYCSSMQKFVSVEDAITDVYKLLKKAKVYISILDFNLESFFMGRRSLFNVRNYNLVGPFDYCLCATPAGKSTDQYRSGIYPSIKPIWQPHPKPMRLSTIAGHGHLRRIRKPLEHARVDPLLKNLAATLKKGLRFL